MMEADLRPSGRRFGLGWQTAAALAAAVLLGTLTRGTAAEPLLSDFAQLLGKLFVELLKAVAPLLVFVSVVAAVAQSRPQRDGGHSLRPVLLLYAAGMVTAALVAVGLSFLFPVFVPLQGVEAAVRETPSGFGGVVSGLLFKLATNPVKALAEANYLSILMWAVLAGLAFRSASGTVREMLDAASAAVGRVVRGIIALAPVGVFGLVAAMVVGQGWQAVGAYLHLLGLIVGGMALMAFVGNPLIVWLKTRRNPYPLVWVCLKESGMMAFLLRSSAANIPVNLNLCRKLGLKEEVYSVSIPLGAAVNMEGAAVTIATLTLAAVYTLGIEVDFVSTVGLILLAVVSAVGASAVPGGALPLLPLAASLFNIDHDVAMQMMAVGMAIMVVQDPCGTALNSSTDVVFTAAADSDYSARTG